MRLSEWRAAAPSREAAAAKVMAVVEPVLRTLGTEADPHCWVAWGDDPSVRWLVLAPTPAGLVTCHVRVNVPQDGPRAAARLTRWPRVQLGELGIETQGERRLLSFQVEGQVLRGMDAEADAIAAFGLAVFAAMDGRPMPEPAARTAARGRKPAARARKPTANRPARATAAAKR